MSETQIQPNEPTESPLQSLVYSWAIAARRMILPALVSGLVVWLGKLGYAGPEAQSIANLAGELIVGVVIMVAHRIDWGKYLSNVQAKLGVK